MSSFGGCQPSNRCTSFKISPLLEGDRFRTNLESTKLQELEQIAQIVQQRLEQYQTGGRTLTLKVKFSDYQLITRSKTSLTPINKLSAIIAQALELFEAIELENRSVRLLGISLSNLDNVKSDQLIQLSVL